MEENFWIFQKKDTRTYENLNYEKCGILNYWGKDGLLNLLLGQVNRQLGKKIKLDTYFTPCPKQTPNIRNLNVKNI